MSLNSDQRAALADLGEHIAAALPNQVLAHRLVGDELTVEVQAASIVSVLTFLRDDANCMFAQLVDISGADYPERDPRFEVVYHLLSLKHNQRVRVKLATDEATPVPSVVKVFSSANWFERECWDMYGVFFADHPDLRRLLSDYGFEGHPLRKDFPLTGFVEVRYDESAKRCVYEPVRLAQEFRSFDFLSPWEGPENFARGVLAGDEKATGKDAG
ncbi:NADH-quinone oxidoreductase subunit C [Roseospirillum parvum]|uniref:NADH-quinone oxidoreductase subunit C n=1 Tax=Roseospirillum parvum TaxID=83401 RepID=A0A1G8B4Q1_9PROT|nr:NADH-quinone oxidoreductase subunit C [Roseospirillum parvum]SDH27983.1 NADH-quinone oxidoreductase subunit C [Roseospirillum parvum]